MNDDLSAAMAFGALLRDDPKAASLYDSCTPSQRQRLLIQMRETPPEKMSAFVAHLGDLL